jgi:hypothetical protein
MKRKVIVLLAAFFACISFFASAQRIKGDKNIVTQERKVSPFSVLDIGGVGDITIKQGSTESVTVTTDENIQPYIETVNEGNKLRIGSKDGVDINSSKLQIEVTVKNISELHLGGTGNVKIAGPITSDNLLCKASGTGNLDLDFACTKLTLKISGTGNVNLKGKGDDASIKMTGAGNLKAFEFAAKNLSAELSGIGNAELNASAELSVDATGMGDISYMGSPKVKKMEATGTGRVRKM